MSELDEFDLIARYFAPLTQGCAGTFNLTDDVAFLSPDVSVETVLTTDMLVAGIHFFPNDPPESVARKLVRTNLSDLAAKAAEPVGLLLGLALPKDTTAYWLERFTNGLATDVEEFACPLLGGDTVSTEGPLTLSLTALGKTPITQPRLLRSAAQVGDDIWVSGSLGDAAWGLAVLRGEELGLSTSEKDFLIHRYRIPQPRLILRDLLRRCAHAAMDISDGLLQDLGHICSASKAGAVIRLSDIPLSLAGQTIVAHNPLQEEIPLTGGDDYEILFTVAVEHRAFLQQWSGTEGVSLTQIGSIVSGDTIVLEEKGTSVRRLAPQRKGWRHFSTDERKTQ